MDGLAALLTGHELRALKELVFWTALCVGVPLASLVCRRRPELQRIVFVLLIGSICESDRLGISFVTREEYRAPIQGFEVLLTDLCALVLGVTLWLERRQHPLRLRVPLLLPQLALIALAAASWLAAADSLPIPEIFVTHRMRVVPPGYPVFETSLYPLFEIFRLVRGGFVFWIVASYVRSEQQLRDFVYAVALSVAYLTVSAVAERVFWGGYRAQAMFRHANNFGIYACMLGAVLMPIVFQLRDPRSVLLGAGAVAGALVCTILSISRSALFAFLLAGVATIGLVSRYSPSRRDRWLIGVGAILSLALLAKSVDTVFDRFVREGYVRQNLAGRMQANSQAFAMARDHPLGVGPGNFSAWSWHRYAAEISDEIEPGVPAHNAWLLTLGEFGWGGVALLGVLWIRVTQLAFAAWRSAAPFAGAVVLGVSLALLALQLHSMLHYSYQTTRVYYLLQVLLGILVATAALTRRMAAGERSR